jgi:hypothetical protein
LQRLVPEGRDAAYRVTVKADAKLQGLSVTLLKTLMKEPYA